MPRLTPGKVQASSQSLSPTVYSMAWGLGLALLAIGKLEAKREFKTKTARKVIQGIRDLIMEDLTADLVENGLLPTLLDPSALPDPGISSLEAAQLYNKLIARALDRYPSLDARRSLVSRYRAACKMAGWSVCENPRCARVFELLGADDGLCSKKCRKSMRNRRAWIVRKSA